MKKMIYLIFIVLFSCNGFNKNKELERKKYNLTGDNSTYFKEDVKLKTDTLQLKENHIVFFRPNRVKYEYLVEKYGQVIIEVDSDFGFTTNAVLDTLKYMKKNSEVFSNVVNNHTVVISLKGHRISLPKEDDLSYGVIIQGNKKEDSKIFKGVYPKEFYIEEFFKLYR